jgi:diguanylate cyclase (GGDEF)-like protein
LRTLSANPSPKPPGSAPQGLFHGYTPLALASWVALVALGMGAVAWALFHVANMPLLAAVVAMSVVTGWFPVRLGRRGVLYVGGEIFFFAVAMSYGAPYAIVAAAVEALAGAIKLRASPPGRVMTLSIAAVAAAVFSAVAPQVREMVAPLGGGEQLQLMLSAIVGAAVYAATSAALGTGFHGVRQGSARAAFQLFAASHWTVLAAALAACVSAMLALIFAGNPFGIVFSSALMVICFLGTFHVYARGAQKVAEAAERHAQQLEHAANHDQLTGLPNRRHFHAHLSAVLKGARSDARVCVVLVDCDGFKAINDKQGHAAGDAFLVHFGRIAKGAVRHDDLVARLGGDEFALLLRVADEAQALEIVQRVVVAMREPVDSEHGPMRSTVSVGLTHTDDPEHGAARLLHEADVAMYAAKSSGKNRAMVYAAHMEEQAESAVSMSADVKDALTRGQDLSIAYQPIVALDGMALHGFEALARWRHPRLAAVAPATFVPVIAELGMSGVLTRWVLSNALAQLRAWQALAGDPLVMAVNITLHDLMDEGFVEFVARTLRANGLPPSALTMDVSEEAMARSNAEAVAALASLRELGVGVAIDDFGVQPWSLARLAELPFDAIKIDPRFVAAASSGAKAGAKAGPGGDALKAIVGLGRALDKLTIAEGVEHDEQHARLRELGCQCGQGALFALPLRAEKAEALMLALASGSPLRRAVPATTTDHQGL